eukprot:NODE_1780_length_1611_cov_101.094086_g1694_i0.p1 GENE.NODE_1780_length_1611_cov_101.094086_g1694_i0~~NODE_1780_length_1611_cov_101.094086_g1694_i0.p1  ORF type:complete len:372 (+),score=27.31 NODE_1780_length_1611_cov_101.094086_g1694_i0:47-1117(+)
MNTASILAFDPVVGVHTVSMMYIDGGPANFQSNKSIMPVCESYLANGCTDRTCVAVHVTPAYSRMMRDRVRHACCVTHSEMGGIAEYESFLRELAALNAQITIQIPGQRKGLSINKTQFAQTVAFQALVRQHQEASADLTIPLTKVCFPHRTRECAAGTRCENVHICREMWEILGSLGIPLASSTPKTSFELQMPRQLGGPTRSDRSLPDSSDLSSCSSMASASIGHTSTSTSSRSTKSSTAQKQTANQQWEGFVAELTRPKRSTAIAEAYPSIVKISSSVTSSAFPPSTRSSATSPTVQQSQGHRHSRQFYYPATNIFEQMRTLLSWREEGIVTQKEYERAKILIIQKRSPNDKP